MLRGEGEGPREGWWAGYEWGGGVVGGREGGQGINTHTKGPKNGKWVTLLETLIAQYLKPNSMRK